MAIKTDLERQLAFVSMLRDGYVLTGADICDMFGIRNVDSFVSRVITRTHLDIRRGRMKIDEFPRTYGGTVKDVFYITGETHPETAGLQELQQATSELNAFFYEPVEWQEGHYLMWICPAPLIDDDEIIDDYCGQFHKVDLGDEELTEVRTVHCVKCGNKFSVQPKGI